MCRMRLDRGYEPESGARPAYCSAGPTGCGKTTLVNLLMRFYEINGGTPRLDGHPIDTVTRDSLRGNPRHGAAGKPG